MKPIVKTTAIRVLQGWLMSMLALILSACSTPSDISPLALKPSDSPLLGKIYHPASGKFIEPEVFYQKIKDSKILLLGETHDNIAHHRGQSEIIKRYVAPGQTALVGLEMITDTQAERMLRARPTNASQLISVLGEEGKGWEYDRYYKIVFQTLFDKGYMITAANLDRKLIADISMHGESAIPQEIHNILQQVPLSEENKKNLQKEIEESHCGMQLGEHANGMINAQRVRDAYMAKVLIDATHKADKALLIAGSGHVRNDRGVPVYAKFLAPQAKMMSLAFVEVVPGHNDPNDYASRWISQRLPFNYVLFTEAVNRPDPCEKLREHMHKFNHHSDQKKSDKKKTSS